MAFGPRGTHSILSTGWWRPWPLLIERHTARRRSRSDSARRRTPASTSTSSTVPAVCYGPRAVDIHGIDERGRAAVRRRRREDLGSFPRRLLPGGKSVKDDSAIDITVDTAVAVHSELSSRAGGLDRRNTGAADRRPARDRDRPRRVRPGPAAARRARAGRDARGQPTDDPRGIPAAGALGASRGPARPHRRRLRAPARLGGRPGERCVARCCPRGPSSRSCSISGP